jgi:uncharacterized protein (TIGR03066 family)
MNAQRLALSVCFVFGLAVAVHAEDAKGVKEKIIGTWVVTESKNLKDAVITFGKDGKGTVTHKVDGNEMKQDFRYEVDGEKLTVFVKDKDGNEQPRPHKIKSVTDKEMVAENDQGEVAKLKKKVD